MKLFIDSANKENKWMLSYWWCDNKSEHSIEWKYTFSFFVRGIKNIIGESKLLFVQTVSTQAKAIVNEAVYIWEALHKKIVVKIPTTVEGIKAIKILKGKRIPTLATTVYTPMNAYVAAKAGADFVAPYVNRIENLSGDGVRIVNEIKQIFSNTNIACKVLAASFKKTYNR
jgi:fructose-6-phosphate aldolase 2